LLSAQHLNLPDQFALGVQNQGLANLARMHAFDVGGAEAVQKLDAIRALENQPIDFKSRKLALLPGVMCSLFHGKLFDFREPSSTQGFRNCLRC